MLARFLCCAKVCQLLCHWIGVQVQSVTFVLPSDHVFSAPLVKHIFLIYFNYIYNLSGGFYSHWDFSSFEIVANETYNEGQTYSIFV